MTNNSPTLEQFWRDGLWFVHQVQGDRRARVFRFEADIFDQSAFLDERIGIERDMIGFRVDFDKLAAGAPTTPPPRANYICHHSHIGSTLLSRIIGIAPGVLSLREPVLLRWLARIQLRDMQLSQGADPDKAYSADLNVCLSLMGRPIEGRHQIVIKASSFTNQVVLDALDEQTEARVLALHGPAEDFIGTVLRKESGTRDITANAGFRMRRLELLLGDASWDCNTLSPGELAAMSWLTEMATMSRMQDVAGARFQWLDFNAFLADMEGVLPQVAGHFGIDWGEDEFRALEESGLLDRHAKRSGEPYDAAERNAQLEKARAEHSEEIVRGMRWLDDLRSRYPDLLPGSQLGW